MLTLKHGIVASSLNILNQVIRRLVGIVSLIILARVLTPEDFGLVAIALIFLNFVDVVTNIGSRSYLLSREQIDDQMVQTSWTLGFLIKNSAGVLLAIAAYFIADFYDDHRLTAIILVLALQILVSTLSSPGLAYKYKQQDLGAITRWQIGSRFVTTGITILIAVVCKSYWAMVIGQFLVVLSYTIASYVIAPKIPKFTLKNAAVQWQFSKWILPQSLTNFFRGQIDALYVSHMFDKATMGAYNNMRYYANVPTSIFVQPILGVTLTQFSEFKNNPHYFTKQLQVAFFSLIAIAAPMVYLFFQHNAFIVDLVLGEQWVEYAALLAIFSLLILLTIINKIVSQVAALKDATKLLFYYSIACVVMHVAIFSFVDFADVYELASIKIGADVVISVLFYVFVLGRLLNMKACGMISLPILICACCLALAGLVTSGLPQINHPIAAFLFESSVFVSAYVLIHGFVMFALRHQIHSFDYLIKRLSRNTP